MRKSKFSEHQIIAILKAVEAGRTVKDVCREHKGGLHSQMGSLLCVRDETESSKYYYPNEC